MSLRSNANDAASDLAEQVEKLRKELADLSSSMAGMVEREKDHALRSARKFADNVSGHIRDYAPDTDALLRQARGHADDLGKALGDEVKRNPLRTLAIAAGIGLLIGALSRGK